jgi:hypothetical protein
VRIIAGSWSKYFQITEVSNELEISQEKVTVLFFSLFVSKLSSLCNK